MTLQAPSITNAEFEALIQRAIVLPGVDTIPFTAPLNFANVANLNVDSGTYTPNNDTLTLRSWASQAVAPNFVILLSDLQVNLSKAFSANPPGTLVLPVQKLYIWTAPIATSAAYLSSLSLIGQTSQPYPMAQATPVNYTLITGQATIT